MKTTIELAKEAHISIRSHYDEVGSTPSELERFAALIRADERELCAKVCDKLATENKKTHADFEGAVAIPIQCAVAVRARKENT